jgi:hypothetical protein
MIEVYFNQIWWANRDADPLEWLYDNIPKNEYHFGKGLSWCNGRQYPASIIFNSEQDAMVFKLKFPGIIKWVSVTV